MPSTRTRLGTWLSFVFSILFTAGSAFAAAATDLIPRSAPQGARVVVVGTGLDAPGIAVQFPSLAGTPIAAPVVSRTATLLEVSVPAGAVSGATVVSSSGSSIGAFAFTVAPDVAVQRVATLAVSTQAHDLLKLPSGSAITSTGTIYVADRLHHQIRVFGLDGTLLAVFGTGQPGFVNGAPSMAQFNEPTAVAVDEARRLVYVADSANNAVRVVTFDGVAATLAGSGSPGDANGAGQFAVFHQPLGVALDPQGNVWVADTGNNKVKIVTPTGAATTVAGSHSGFADGAAAQALFASPSGVAVSATGTVYVADTKNNAVRKLENGIVSTVAGTGHSGFIDGIGKAAEFSAPLAVTVDDMGGVLVADSNNNAVRRIAFGTSGASVTTIAGNTGKPGYVDGAPATAQFHTPAGIAASGVILVGDSANNALRALYAALQATALYPARGPLAGGNVIRVFGTGFIPGPTSVTFGGTPATNVAFVTSTELLVTIPAGTIGTVDVTVSAAGVTSALPAAYTFLPPPTITAVTPAKGKTAGGETVDVSGTNFGSASDTAVYFGGIAATIVNASPTDITVLTPPGNAGPVDVRVSAPGGDVTRSAAFTYFAPPVIASFSPAQGGPGATVTITGQNFDPDPTGDQVFFGALRAMVSSATTTQLTVTVPAGATSGPITITTAGGTATSSSSFVVAAFSALQVTASTTTLDVGESIQFNAVGVLTTGGGVDVTAKASWSITAGGALSVSSTGVVSASSSGTADVTATLNGLSATIHVTASAVAVPPLPSTVAPPLPRNQIVPFLDQTSFLYSGTTPIQTGVLPGTIVQKRAAVIRGSVKTRDGAALAGVRIHVASHPELGATMTRTDGLYDMAVNGGGLLTVIYEKPGYFTTQRTVDTPWSDYVWADDVILVAADTAVTLVTSGATSAQVARASVVTDERGTRQATLVFSPGTQASLTMPDGSSRPLASLSVRATEYTVGSGGKAAMPAPLPAGSAYTYCVELSTDEALASGATGVTFTQPVNTYLENFLDLPVGVAVPAGYLDHAKGVWIPSPNGRVIQVLSITNGVANVDTDGDGLPDDGSVIGMNIAERTQLATLYSAGQIVWRVPVTHFTVWDFNFPVWIPSNLKVPRPKASTARQVDKGCSVRGSIVECESQTLGERIPISGTPISLVYASDRTIGRQAARDVKVTLEDVPPGIDHIALTTYFAGQRYDLRLNATGTIEIPYHWDGRDAYGRIMTGSPTVTAVASYGVPFRYAGLSQNFGLNLPLYGNFSWALVQLPQHLDVDLVTQTFEISRSSMTRIGDAHTAGEHGWSFDVKHDYDFMRRRVNMGDDTRRSADDAQNHVLKTIAGNGDVTRLGPGSNGSATDASLGTVWGMVIGPDGAAYLNEVYRVSRVDPGGTISTIAGSGTDTTSVYTGEGGPATAATFNAEGIALGPDSTLYIADLFAGRLLRVQGGIISTIAGNGTGARSGGVDDGKFATDVGVSPNAVAVAPDGSIYIAEDFQIRRILTDGRIYTIAGLGSSTSDGAQAIASRTGGVSIAVDPTGTVYYCDLAGVRSITPDGTIHNVAGCYSSPCVDTDGGPATSAYLDVPWFIALDRAGNLYITETHGTRVRAVSPDGIIRTVAGTLVFGDQVVEGQIATQANIGHPRAVSTDAEGNIYMLDSASWRVRRIEPQYPGISTFDTLIGSESGSQVYVFHGSRHTKTVDALTNTPLFTFEYDTSGNVTGIVDLTGNRTTVERDAAGNMTAIVAPGGQRTTITPNDQGAPASISDPMGNTYQFTYYDGDLLHTTTSPRGFTSTFSYDDSGLLQLDADAAQGSTALTRVGPAEGYTVTRTTAEGRVSNYEVQFHTDDSISRVMAPPDGSFVRLFTDAANNTTMTLSDGTRAVGSPTPDPRWGMSAPLSSSASLTWPSGSMQVSSSRQASLADKTNPFSLTTLSQTNTVNGKVWTSTYDASTRTIVNQTPLGRATTTFLDSLGRVARVQRPGFADTLFTYDDLGRLAEIDAGSRKTIFGYDANNNLSSVTDPLNRTVTFSFDPAGRPLTETLPDQSIASFSYDRNGNLVSVQPPQRPPHLFAFTPVDLPNLYTPPTVTGGGATRYTYNRDRQMTSIVRPDGSSIGFGYDGAGRMSTLNVARGAFAYSYDSAGRIQTITDPDGGSITAAYSGLRPASMTWSGTVHGSVNFTWDNNLRLASDNVQGNTVTYQYDDDGFLTAAGALTLTPNAQTGLLAGTALGTVSDSWTRDAFGKPASYTATSSGNVAFGQTFTRDNGGRITKLAESVFGNTATFEYGYDSVGRLQTVTRNGTQIATYGYDANGNRVSAVTPNGSVTATYDDQDRLLTYGNAVYAYGANGELLSKTDPTGNTTYTYDELGNLLHVDLPNGSKIDYVIDGRNRRVGKKLNGTLVRQWLYADQFRVIAELDGGGNVISRFVYGSRWNSPDYMVKGGVTYRIISDHLGSPRAVVDTATGLAAEIITHDEFGNITGDSSPGFQPFGFSGGLYDSDTGLVRFGARDYDPLTGRWTTKDPLGFGGTDTNVYAYCGSDPVNRVDPFGTYWTDDAMTVLANFSAGFGDAISRALTFGLWSTADLRKWEDDAMGVSSVDYCSGSYTTGKVAGYVEATATMWAAGLNGGSQSVFWSGFSQGARATAESLGGTTLEQTVIGGTMDYLEHGLGVPISDGLWNLASRTFAYNASGEATAVIRAAGYTWTNIEQTILASRGIPINFVP